MGMVRAKESLTVGAENSLRENDTSLLNRSACMCFVPIQGVLKGLNTSFAAAILRDRRETNQMTTERREGRFRRTSGSHLFRRMTREIFAPFICIRNPPTLPTNCCGGTATVLSEPTPKPQPQHPRLGGLANAAEANHQTSKFPLHGSYQMSSVVSSSHGSNEKHSRTSVQDNHETATTSTSPSKPRAPTLSRALSQDWESSQPHRGGTDDLPSSGNVLASKDPHRQETVPRKIRLHTPGRMNRRMNSENVFRNGHTPQFGQFLTPGAGQMPVEGQEDRPRFPSTLQSLLANDFRYAVGCCPISP